MADTTALSSILELLGEAIGDHYEFDTTTNITTNNYVYSTALNSVDKTADDRFNSWSLYVSGGNNTVDRVVKDYTTSGGRLEVYGAALSSESGAITCQLHKYSRAKKVNAINQAINELFPTTSIPLDNKDLITGNILPPFNWSTTALLDVYTEPSGTLLKNTDKAYIWNGTTSAKITASGSNDYLYVTSDDYPRLLDLMDRQVDYKCWVYPEVADDAFLTIYTLKSDGTAQTLNSTTTTYASKKNLIEMVDQAISDDIQKIELRIRVATNTKYSYFDAPRLIGQNIFEYLLPDDFQNGILSEVYIQTSGHADDPCDDLQPECWQQVYGFDPAVWVDGFKYVRLDGLYPQERRIRLKGAKTLEALTSATDTITLTEPQLRVLVAKSAELLYRSLSSEVSSEDRGFFDAEWVKWKLEARSLSRLSKSTVNTSINLSW